MIEMRAYHYTKRKKLENGAGIVGQGTVPVVNRSLPVAAASAAAVEAAPLVSAQEGVPGSGTACAAPREAAQAGLTE
jgi:hypothetical protein